MSLGESVSWRLAKISENVRTLLSPLFFTVPEEVSLIKTRIRTNRKNQYSKKSEDQPNSTKIFLQIVAGIIAYFVVFLCVSEILSACK